MTDHSGYYVRWSSNNQYYFVLKAVNGQVLVTSETYTTKAAALDGIASVKRTANAGTVDMTK